MPAGAKVSEGGKDRLIVALDVPTSDEARRFVHDLDGVVSFYKIGLELLMTGGMERLLTEFRGKRRVFIDLKLAGDIPETVRRAVAVGARMGAEFLTLGTSVSAATIRAAREGRGDSPHPKLLFVSYLSSLDRADFAELHGRSVVDFEEIVIGQSAAALESGCDGFIASGEFIRRLRLLHAGALIVSPGIRPPGAATDDHKRSNTPQQAIAAGADYLVVGRPIRDAVDRRAAALEIIGQIDTALGERR